MCRGTPRGTSPFMPLHFTQKIVKYHFFSSKSLAKKVVVPWQWKFDSIVLRAGYTHSKNLKALQLEKQNFGLIQLSLFFSHDKACKKSLASWQRKFYSISTRTSCIHSKNVRALWFLWHKYRSQFFWYFERCSRFRKDDIVKTECDDNSLYAFHIFSSICTPLLLIKILSSKKSVNLICRWNTHLVFL
jgi:hypothetical protein